MIKNCRVSKDKLIPFLNLGKQPIANGFLINKDKIKKEYFYNLRVGFSKKSKMVQLLQVPKKEKMFNKNYAFFLVLQSTWIFILKSFQNKSKNL